MHYVKPVIQVFPEFSGAGHCFQVTVGCGYHAHIHFPALGRADLADLAFLQHSQQPGLGFCRQFADLIKEQAAAIGGLNQTGAGGNRTGECAFLMAEQLRFNQALGNGRAVH